MEMLFGPSAFFLHIVQLGMEKQMIKHFQLPLNYMKDTEWCPWDDVKFPNPNLRFFFGTPTSTANHLGFLSKKSIDGWWILQG